MPDEPKQNGLKLSMISQPVNRPTARPVQRPTKPQPLTEADEASERRMLRKEWVSTLRAARLKSDLTDFLITLALTIAFTTLITALQDHSGDRHLRESVVAILAFITLLPFLFPIVSLVYTAGSYLAVGNTRGKQVNSLQVATRAGSPASRRRCVVRPLIKWGGFCVALFLLVGILTAVASFGDGEIPDFIRFSAAPIVTAVLLLMILFLVVDQITALARPGRGSLIDVMTKTRVIFKEHVVEEQTISSHSEL